MSVAAFYVCQFSTLVYKMAPGQYITQPVGLNISATDNVEGGDPSMTPYNGQAIVEMQAPDINGQIAMLYDMGGRPIPSMIVQFTNSHWQGRVSFYPFGSSVPGGNFLDVGVKATETSPPQVPNAPVVAGGTRFPLRIILPQPAPLPEDVVRLYNMGRPIFEGKVPHPADLRLTLDEGRGELLLFPPNIFGGSGAYAVTAEQTE